MTVTIMQAYLVKAREGRPIWVKGNKDFGLTRGGVTPRVGASVLNLYNSDRLQDVVGPDPVLVLLCLGPKLMRILKLS